MTEICSFSLKNQCVFIARNEKGKISDFSKTNYPEQINCLSGDKKFYIGRSSSSSHALDGTKTYEPNLRRSLHQLFYPNFKNKHRRPFKEGPVHI